MPSNRSTVGVAAVILAVWVVSGGAATVGTAHFASKGDPLDPVPRADVRTVSSLPPAAFHGSLEAPSVAESPGWWNISAESTTTPPIFWFTQGTWDAADGYLMFYGGDDFQGTNLASTWAYSQGSWTEINASGPPGGLDGPALAYDPPAGEVVMYGGVESYSPFHYTNLTWFYSGGNWTSAHLNPTPPPRLAASMVYDADLGGVVLFGGYNNSDPSGATLLNDLWLFKGGAWSHLAASNPPPVRTWAPIAYDAHLHELVLYSGLDSGSACIGDTWTYSNGSWTQVHVPVGGPPISCTNALGYDPDLGEVVLTGGYNTTTSTSANSSYGFNGSAWAPLNVSGGPDPHDYGISAWDPTEHSFVVAGGWPSYTATDVLSIPLTLVNLTRPPPIEVDQNVAFHAGAIGGVPSRTYLWNWGDGSPPTVGPDPQHAFASQGPFTVSVTVTDAASNEALGNVTVTVGPGPTVAITAGSPVGDVGSPVNFSAMVPTNSTGDTFAWTFGDGGQANGSSAWHNYSIPGNYSVIVMVTDPVGGRGSAQTNMTIFPTLSMHLAPPSGAEVGVPVSFAAAIAGGAPPLTYLWSFSDGGTATTPTPTHRFASSGAQTVGLTIQDAADVTVSQQESISVVAAVGATITGPATLNAGSTGNWSVVVNGGSGPFLIVWTFPDGSSSHGPSGTFAFSGSGVYAVHVEVTDSLGGTVNATQEVHVASSSSVLGGTVAGIPALLIGGAVVVIAIAAVVGVLLMRRRPPPTGNG